MIYHTNNKINPYFSAAGGEEPLWSPDGREIIYRFGVDWLSVSFSDQPELDLGEATVVLSGPFINVAGYSWDLSPDGQRFLVIENPEASSPLTELVVISNFFDEVRRRIPTD